MIRNQTEYNETVRRVREQAKRLGVSESQCSRDERNEDHVITVDRAQRVLEALGVEITTKVSSLGSSKRPRLVRA